MRTVSSTRILRVGSAQKLQNFFAESLSPTRRIQAQTQLRDMTAPAKPRPSASILLVSPANEVLLLHRVQTSSAFPSAHVFPGGNLSRFHESGHVELEDPLAQGDSPEFRAAAIRETFEESGILLAVDAAARGGRPVELTAAQRDAGRRAVHANEVTLSRWLEGVGGVPDLQGLRPFTRWITPGNVPRRFNTQMYLYMLPLSSGTATDRNVVPATSDGGLEHTEAVFAPPRTWLERARRGDIVMFPPQVYLLSLVAEHLQPPNTDSSSSLETRQQRRESLLRFVQETPSDGVAWADKVISPSFMGPVDKGGGGDDRIVLGLSRPRGDPDRVVYVKLEKGGSRFGEVRMHPQRSTTGKL
ncbi:hypothetical protein RB601_008168 [Gaeumannomyces tritici]